MFSKGLAIFALLFALQQTLQEPLPRPASENPTATGSRTAVKPSATAAATKPAGATSTPTGGTSTPTGGASAPAGGASQPADCNGFPCDQPQPQPKVIPVNPPPTPSAWPLHERILWIAYVVLAFIGYAGVLMALAMMRKIERQTVAAETAAEAARNSAQAALMNSQAIINSERPWILVTVEPSLHVDNGFMVTAINRGRSPAQIVSTTELVQIAADESKLPKKSEYDSREAVSPKVPTILLPGESTGLKPFSRADAKGYCESDEQFARIESWDEKIYLFGRVVYRDLIAPPEAQFHQTDWCCWYIHGRQKSGLVIAGPPDYNLHT